MSLRIQNNIDAFNAHRNLVATGDQLSKSMERLSSGYRINRAADDSAGLAISEKLRAQATGLDQAQRNAQDAVSLVSTAEGAMSEVHAMLEEVEPFTRKFLQRYRLVCRMKHFDPERNGPLRHMREQILRHDVRVAEIPPTRAAASIEDILECA